MQSWHIDQGRNEQTLCSTSMQIERFDMAEQWYHRKWKFRKKRQIFFSSQIRRLFQNIWNFVFSDFNPLFFAICCNLVKYCWKQIFLYLPRQFFDTKLDLNKCEQHVLATFCCFFNFPIVHWQHLHIWQISFAQLQIRAKNHKNYIPICNVKGLLTIQMNVGVSDSLAPLCSHSHICQSETKEEKNYSPYFPDRACNWEWALRAEQIIG